MVTYDFDTLYPRLGVGAGKWQPLEQSGRRSSPDVFPFSVADMDFKTAPEIQKALHDAADFAIYGYFSPTDAYKQAICDWQMRRHGFECKPEWIVQVPNIVAALYQLVRTFTNPGDGVIIQPPVYAPFFHAVERQNRRLILNPLIREQTRYVMDLNDLEAKAADPDARLMILCNPHNPVGRVFTREELEAVARICQAHHLLLVCDEIHADLVFEPHRHTVIASLDDETAANSIICSSPSKTFNLAGLSNANLIIPSETLRARYQSAEEQTGFHCNNYFGTVACQAAYEKGENWYQALMHYLSGNRAMLADTLRKERPEFLMNEIEGTYLGWVDMRSLGLKEKERRQWLSEAELYFVSGELFGPGGEGFERINIALPRRALKAGLDRLIGAVRKGAC